MIRANGVYKNIKHVESMGAGIRRSVEASLFVQPLAGVFGREITADAVIVDAVTGYFDLPRIDIRAVVIGVAPSENRRVTIAVEVKSPLSELEELLADSGAIEDLSLEVLIAVEVHEGEPGSSRHEHGYAKQRDAIW